MPYYDEKKKWWVGSVRKKIQGNLAHLLGLPNWTADKKQPGLFNYRKSKAAHKLKREASQWEKDHWQKIIDTQVNPQTRLTFSDVSTEYLKLTSPRWKGRETLNYKTRLIYSFIGFCGVDPVLPIETVLIEKFLNHTYEEQGGKKANRSLRELNTIFLWMTNRKFIPDNPVTPIDQFDEEDFKKYVPPAEDVRAAINAATAFEKDLLRTAYHSLARSVEIRRLKCSDCDFVNKKVWFATRKRRGGTLDRTHIDMNKSLHEILYRRVKLAESEYVFPSQTGKRLSKNTLDNVMPRIFKKLNNTLTKVATTKGERAKWIPKPDKTQIKPFGFHAIRHHVAARLFLNEGYNVAEMQKILRHKRASTTDTYLKSIVDMDSARGLSVLDDFENAPADFTEPENNIIGYPDHE